MSKTPKRNGGNGQVDHRRQEVQQIVKNAWKAFATHDPEQIAAVFTDDAQWLAPPGNATAKALGHTEHVLRTGHAMAAVRMAKRLR